MSEIAIIEGSKEWITKVPDEYCIKCVGVKKCDNSEIKRFYFTYVVPVTRFYGSGFITRFGFVNVPKNIDRIVISLNDVSDTPSVFFRGDNKLLVTTVFHKEKMVPEVDAVEFNEIWYYSNRTHERQRVDEKAPGWVKKIASRYHSNVAYFKI